MAEADTVDLLMVFPPRPIRSVITVIPLLPFNVVTMRFMLPLDIVRSFSRPHAYTRRCSAHPVAKGAIIKTVASKRGLNFPIPKLPFHFLSTNLMRPGQDMLAQCSRIYLFSFYSSIIPARAK